LSYKKYRPGDFERFVEDKYGYSREKIKQIIYEDVQEHITDDSLCKKVVHAFYLILKSILIVERVNSAYKLSLDEKKLDEIQLLVDRCFQKYDGEQALNEIIQYLEGV